MRHGEWEGMNGVAMGLIQRPYCDWFSPVNAGAAALAEAPASPSKPQHSTMTAAPCLLPAQEIWVRHHAFDSLIAMAVQPLSGFPNLSLTSSRYII